jgi:branched-subunit amino acid aminotransferase/4-amino-4-deoxychorismate lyase
LFIAGKYFSLTQEFKDGGEIGVRYDVTKCTVVDLVAFVEDERMRGSVPSNSFGYIFDRGFLMADAVYEVVSVLDGKLLDYEGHEVRLARSLGELEIPAPCTNEELLEIHRELVRRNELTEGMIYLQVTRGAADRDFAWAEGMTPSLVLFTQAKSIAASPLAERGAKVVALPDLRWARRDIIHYTRWGYARRACY